MTVNVTLQSQSGKRLDCAEEKYEVDIFRVLDGGALLLFRVDPKSNLAETVKAFAPGTWVFAERVDA